MDEKHKTTAGEEKAEQPEVYGIGQKLVFAEDRIQAKAFGHSTLIRKGTPVFIGADKRFAHYLNGDIQPLGDSIQVQGYNTDGLAEWVYEYVSGQMPLDDMIEEYGETKENFIKIVSEALQELGMYDDSDT